jgi:hypothetical protein
MTVDEREHIRLVKSTACAVCDSPPPVSAHHIRQGRHFTTIGLCQLCHQGSILGWHGQRVAWSIRKMDELDALNKTLSRVAQLRHNQA